MRSRFFLLVGATVLAGVACAQGSSFTGGGAGAGDTTTVTTTGSSSFLAVSSSGPGTNTNSTSTGSGTCSESPCKLAPPQCGCGAGQECTILSYMPACQPVGTNSQGEGCMGQGSCAAGLLCVGGGTTGVCDQFCSSDADCSATGGICALTLSDGTATGTIPNATLCSGNCNPVTGIGCTVAGTGCQLGRETTGQMRWLTYCASTGTIPSGGTCTSSSDCEPNYGCLNTGTSDQCLEYCNVSDASACGGAGCGALQDANMNAIVVNGITLGACSP